MDFGEMFTRLSDLAGDAAGVAGDDTQLSSRVVTVIRLNHVVEQILFRLTGELDARGIATKNGDGSTARLLQQAGMAPAAAHRYVRVGTALDDIASVAAYAVDGALSGEHMDAIVKGLHHIDRRNPDLADGDRSDCVRGLMAEALSSASPAAVSIRARQMALALSPPDKEIPDAENQELNELTFGTGDDGRTHGTLDVDGLLGEKLAAALGPLSKQVPEPDGSADSRTFAQRRADALERLLDSYLAQEDRPTMGGVRPHVSVTMTPEDVQALQLRGLGDTKAPAMAPSFEWTGPISASTAHMVACDSVITRILLDHNGVPLDVGRDQRTVTPAIQRSWMCVSWLWLPCRLHRRAPHRVLATWRWHESDQHGPVVPAASPLHPPPRVDGIHRWRWSSVVHRARRCLQNRIAVTRSPHHDVRPRRRIARSRAPGSQNPDASRRIVPSATT